MTDTPRTLPPDPSVAGLWWVQHEDDFRVWKWSPDRHQWDTGQDDYGAYEADQYGWRVVGPAVPPGDKV